MPAPLPQRTLDFLEFGAPEGQRNQEIHFAAQQFRDAGYNQSEATQRIATAAVLCGTSWEEAVSAVRSAYRQAKRSPIITVNRKTHQRTGYGNTYHPSRSEFNPKPVIDAEPRALPDPFLDNGLEAFFTACFKSSDYISIGRGHVSEDGERIVPDGGETKTAGEWLEWIASFKPKNGLSSMERAFFGSQGIYIRVNPMKDGGEKDSDVTEFRNCLVEFDGISKEQQLGAMLQSGLPFSAITDSAGKSVHGICKVDAKDRSEFDERVRIVHEVFSEYGIDQQNKNPSRYSRLPDGKRGDKYQRLLMVSVGAESWDDWMDANEDDGLPPIQDTVDEDSEEIPEPEQLIEGILYKGSKMVLGGPSKARKTWVLMDLAISVAYGIKWLGFLECKPGKVLYINFELIKYSFKKRRLWVQDSKSISTEKDKIHTWHLRGHASDISHLVDKVIRRLKTSPYDLIVVDPIYKSLGGRDENSAGQMTELMNHLERMAVETGASIVFGAHFPKGDMGIRESIDRIAGSGVFARDPDTVVTMSPQTRPKDGKDETVRFDIEITLRDFPERKPFVVYWDVPLMIVDPTRKPGQNLAGKPGAPVVYPMHEALEVLPPEGLTTTQWMNELKCGKDTMAQIIRDAKNSELISKISPKSPWIPNIEKIQKQVITPLFGQSGFPYIRKE